ncbi:MAG TPA: DUF5362 family protein [Thermoanaerobaculia bacterium]
MTTLDPYAAPAAPGGGTYAPDVPQGAVEALRGTRPWVLLFSILGFLVAALIFFAGLAVLLGGGAFLLGGVEGGGAASGGMMFGLGFVYLLLGFLYLVPSLYLYRYASRIARMLAGGGVAALVEALDQQRRFWRLAGIVAVVMIVLYVVVFAIAIVAGMAGAFG